MKKQKNLQEENIMEMLNNKHTNVPTHKFIFLSAALALGTMMIFAHADSIHGHFTKAQHFAENTQPSFGIQSLNGHPKKGGFTHILYCYKLSKSAAFKTGYISECPKDRYIKIYDHSGSRTRPEIQGKMSGGLQGKKIRFYNFEFYAPRESVQGRICFDDEEECGDYFAHIDNLKQNRHEELGMVMATALFFSSRGEFIGTVDLTQLWNKDRKEPFSVMQHSLRPGDYKSLAVIDAKTGA
jgi:hypothetical protein